MNAHTTLPVIGTSQRGTVDRMRILHLVPTLSAGGAETFVADLAVAQRWIGHEVEVFLLAGARGDRGAALLGALETASVPCIGAESRNPRDPRNLLRLLRQIVVGRYDVVHAHLFTVELVLAVLIPLLRATRRRPLLVRTLHNSDIFGTRSRALARLLARSFDWNFACGSKVLDNYVELFGPERASVVENGVSIPATESAAGMGSVRNDLSLPDEAFLVACVGAFRGTTLATGQKAQDVAIRAFRRAFGTDPSTHLLLVGDGPLRAEAEALAGEIGARDNVHFLGNLPHVHAVLRETDLLFMPSRHEGLPMVGLEAGCSGLPVLASSIDELVAVGAPYGWTFSRDNSVEDFAAQLAAVRTDLQAVQNRARAMAGPFRERYGIGRCAREYLSQLQAMLDRRRWRAG